MDIRGIPLMPSVARQIMEELFQKQQQWRRGALIREVQRLHEARGGARGKQNPVSTIKKALHDLSDDGRVHNVGYGHWRWASPERSQPPPDDVDSVSPETVDASDADDDAISVEKEIGEGLESVYVYFNPNDRELATLKNRAAWECKVGRTGVSEAIPRIVSQGGTTALSHVPVIGLVIRTQDSAALEKALHASLRLAEAEVEGSPGTEWFMTSPSQIETWYLGFERSVFALKRPEPG